MKIERHPYGTYIPKNPRAMIIGTFPIGKFSDPKRRKEIKPHEFDFPFGGEKNLLWRLLGDCFGVKLTSVEEIKKLLQAKGLALGDLIKSCRRREGRASDSDLYDIVWNRKLLDEIDQHGISKLFFTSKQAQRWFNQLYPEADYFEQILLPSPSAQTARGLVRNADYILWKQKNPEGKSYDYILNKYKEAFYNHNFI